MIANILGLGFGGAILLGAYYAFRALRVYMRLQSLVIYGAIAGTVLSVATYLGYVEGGRLLADLWELGRAAVDVALPWARRLLAG